MVLALKFMSLIHSELAFIYDEIKVQLPSFACGYPVLSGSFAEEIILSLLNTLDTLFY